MLQDFQLKLQFYNIAALVIRLGKISFTAPVPTCHPPRTTPWICLANTEHMAGDGSTPYPGFTTGAAPQPEAQDWVSHQALLQVLG